MENLQDYHKWRDAMTKLGQRLDPITEAMDVAGSLDRHIVDTMKDLREKGHTSVDGGLVLEALEKDLAEIEYRTTVR